MKRVLAIGLVLCAGICSVERVNFDANWKFIQKDAPKAEQVTHSDAQWRTLDLPHDWTVNDTGYDSSTGTDLFDP